MPATLGVDHGTKGLRFCHLKGEERSFFEIDRGEAAKTSVLTLLEAEGFLDIDLIGLTYSMADGVDAILDASTVENRGQADAVTGELVGGGTRLFDEVVNSSVKAVLIPGLHRGIECLDERFRLLYSHMAASEKVALSYHAFLEVNKSMKADNLLISDISSNTVTIAIKGGNFFGAVDACLGAPGLLHGPLDLERIRGIDRGRFTANKAFYSAGVSQLAGLSPEAVLDRRTEKGRGAIDALILAVEMEVFGIAGVVETEAIAIAGELGVHDTIFRRLQKTFESISPVYKLSDFAAAEGAAEIARDLLNGKEDFLGIGVKI